MNAGKITHTEKFHTVSAGFSGNKLLDFKTSIGNPDAWNALHYFILNFETPQKLN